MPCDDRDLNDVAKREAGGASEEQEAAVELVRLAKERGLSLTGPDGLLKQLTKTVLETAERRDHRAPGVCQARSGRGQVGEHP